MKKNLLFAAIALTALAGCSDNSFVGDESPQGSLTGDGAISFNMKSAPITRADKQGSAAATDLSNQFIVYAEKAETADGAAPAAGKLVFQNYKVAYTANSAYTTTSNTKNWEYVGQQWTSGEQSHITTSTTDAQTIKYWDWGAGTYTFTAVSALPSDISSGNVSITKTTAATTGNLVYDKGYSVALTASADLDKLFFSERKVITSTNNTDRDATNAYGGNVTLRFHNMASKVRVAMYENIPGYSVTINSFKVVDNASPTFETMTTTETGRFKANFVNNAKGTAGSMTVKYVASGTTVNHPTVSFTPTSDAANILTLGDQLKAAVTIGESATGATYDKAAKAYTSVFPKEDNTQNLKLKVCYTLTAPVTGETIVVTDATAEVPAEYLKWKPGYAYTYIFKISDNTNGSTGTPVTNPAGLYPITFDAIETVDNDGLAEYITTVSEPTITTFGYDATSKKFVTDGSEYAANKDIYATFTEGSTVKTPTFGGSGEQHVNVFSVVSKDPTNFKITEASVAEAIANPGRITNSVYTCTVTYTIVSAETTLADGTKYYKADSESRIPGATGYVPTLAVAGTDYTVGSTTRSVDVYTCSVTDVTEVTDPTTLAAGTTYYKKYGEVAPGSDGYVVTIAAEGTDYEVAPVITATTITNENYSTNFSAAPAKVTTVPGEDGVNKTIDALKLTGVKAGTYAIEYEASAAWTGSYNKVYKVIVVQ
jgi:hypothetical protein